ncbi:MAG: rRNA maturation RNase YbeY [Pseudomonadota bacterium]
MTDRFDVLSAGSSEGGLAGAGSGVDVNAAKMIGIDIIIDCDAWLGAGFDLEALAASCARAVARQTPAPRGAQSGDVAILFTDDDKIRDLNHRFRQRDKATNVLSFPAGSDQADTGILGDIALGFETCASEAAAGPGMKAHTAHLLVHGILHLLGYDHEDDRDADEMEAMETQILAALGFKDPYANGEPLGADAEQLK